VVRIREHRPRFRYKSNAGIYRVSVKLMTQIYANFMPGLYGHPVTIAALVSIDDDIYILFTVYIKSDHHRFNKRHSLIEMKSIGKCVNIIG